MRALCRDQPLDTLLVAGIGDRGIQNCPLQGKRREMALGASRESTSLSSTGRSIVLLPTCPVAPVIRIFFFTFAFRPEE
jgi:hypothetical protein